MYEDVNSKECIKGIYYICTRTCTCTIKPHLTVITLFLTPGLASCVNSLGEVVKANYKIDYNKAGDSTVFNHVMKIKLV